ncbi:MAG: hypothetical protein ACE5F1_06430 [Planctomycetota bacterium]
MKTIPLLAVLVLAATVPIRSTAAQTLFDYQPTAKKTILRTDITWVQPKNGPPFVVVGGVFTFRNVKLNQGIAVHGQGPNPMIWIVTGDFIVDGHLGVDGGPGESVHTLNSPNFPAKGGIGACTGGNGGKGSPQTTRSSLLGEQGFGPFQLPRLGGFGGASSTLINGSRGTGGGGGSLAAQGDPRYPFKGLQQRGFGGTGGQSSFASPPGPLLFRDGRNDNDFWGVAVNVFTKRLVVGELPFPIGGQGGGGGGDQMPNPFNWMQDRKGAGGGGGGGVIIVFALGRISIGAQGKISADGGNGGGGAWVGSNRFGGGGGGGSGGMVVLASRQFIELQVHGETYANGDYSFSVSADGGIGLQESFGTRPFLSKYPPKLHPATNGGMGGMGIVQLMAPIGPNLDRTNTILDDNIRVMRGATQLGGAQKIRYLAWRGFPNKSGVWVDDSGKPTNIGANEGDIRPSPILLPLF